MSKSKTKVMLITVFDKWGLDLYKFVPEVETVNQRFYPEVETVNERFYPEVKTVNQRFYPSTFLPFRLSFAFMNVFNTADRYHGVRRRGSF